MAEVLGALAAVTASALFSAGLLLQAREARTLAASPGLGLDMVRRLLRRRRWVLGGLVMVVGFAFHTGSLTLAPLTLVQPSLAAGLLVLLAVGARLDGEPIGARELAGVGAITLGVVGLTLTSPERTTVSAGTLTLTLALASLAAIALLPLLAPGARASGVPATLGAGTAYALTGVTTKLLSDGLDTGAWLAAAFWLATTALGGGLALLDQTAALQRRGATQVGVVIYVLPVIVPVLLAPVLFGEDWDDSPAGGLPLALSVAAVCAGAATLAASRRVVALET